MAGCMPNWCIAGKRLGCFVPATTATESL
jgi:hypothetical protein